MKMRREPKRESHLGNGVHEFPSLEVQMCIIPDVLRDLFNAGHVRVCVMKTGSCRWR